MDGTVFSTWFDELFRPYIRQRTGRKTLLILDNAPGHRAEFEVDGIRVVFFPPNVTSWKQSMDMGIITALKKRYKFLMMKDIIAHHDSPQRVKDQLAVACSKMKGGAAGIMFEKPAHLLDAAKYIEIAWNSIS